MAIVDIIWLSERRKRRTGWGVNTHTGWKWMAGIEKLAARLKICSCHSMGHDIHTYYTHTQAFTSFYTLVHPNMNRMCKCNFYLVYGRQILLYGGVNTIHSPNTMWIIDFWGGKIKENDVQISQIKVWHQMKKKSQPEHYGHYEKTWYLYCHQNEYNMCNAHSAGVNMPPFVNNVCGK